MTSTYSTIWFERFLEPISPAQTAAEVAFVAGYLHGRLILDLYHREFFVKHQGIRIIERDHLTIIERKSMRGDRLTVNLDYGPERDTNRFEWQLYTPDSLRTLAERCGFTCLAVCTRFDDQMPASVNDSRIQIVMEKAEAPMVDSADWRNTCPGL